MKAGRLLGLVAVHLRASRVSGAFAVVGVAVGVSFLCFFIGLGEGVRAQVLNKIFPADQLEIVPRTVRVFGVEGTLGQPTLDAGRVARVAAISGVLRALGTQKSAFPAKLWGGRRLLGYDLHTEAFFEGLPTGLMRAELEQTERVVEKRAQRAQQAPERCDVGADCPAGARCLDGGCEGVEWAGRFNAIRLHLRCLNDKECVHGATCVRGRCLVAGTLQACQLQREQDSDAASCPSHLRCELHDGKATCEPIRCRLHSADDARNLDPTVARGRVTTPGKGAGCVAGQCPTSSPCPSRLYCAADQPGSLVGTCEWPLPTIVNPLLLEVFNSDMAASLNLAKVASAEILYGVRYHIAVGDSHFTKDAIRRHQQVKQAVVVGFSAKAPELGVALPLAFVRHNNARIRGRDAAATFDAVLLQVRSNEDVAGVIQAVEAMGFSLSRRSRVARTFGTVVFLIYLVLLLLSFVVLAVAAANITHTLAMLVHERRRELAVLRALGATALDVALIVMLEGVVLGVSGGLLGLVLAWGSARVVERAAVEALQGLPLVPDHFFDFPLWLAPAALCVAVAFCLVGSLVPARRATRLDPATVLSQP